MRVRVSLDFDILIESFISLCIIETVGAIFREYRPWIVLLITQWSKSSKTLALSLGLFDLSFIIRCTEVKDTPKALNVLWYTLSNETIGFFVAFSLLKKANNFFTNCWHSGDKSDFRDRPFNLRGGYGFLFRSEIFFRTTRELEYLFFFVAQSEIFFPGFNIR